MQNVLVLYFRKIGSVWQCFLVNHLFQVDICFGPRQFFLLGFLLSGFEDKKAFCSFCHKTSASFLDSFLMTTTEWKPPGVAEKAYLEVRADIRIYAIVASQEN